MSKISDDTPGDIFVFGEQPRCRNLLCYLLQHDRPLPLTDVVRHIAHKESASQHDVIPSNVYEDIQNSLERQHLPRLVDADLVILTRRYDQRMLSLTSNIQYLKPSLQPYAVSKTISY